MKPPFEPRQLPTVIKPFPFLRRKKLHNLPNITVLGAGGNGAHRVALYYHALGFPVHGYDIKQTEKTEKLEKAGIPITYENPQGEIKAPIILYSFTIPKHLIDQYRENNPKSYFIEIGGLIHKLGRMYTSSSTTTYEKKRLFKYRISPLYSLNMSGITTIGVTGTDGKTTTCMLLHHILTQLGYKAGVISTVSTKIGKKEIDSDPRVTTPSADELYEIIKKMKKARCSHIIIESSSQGLASERLIGLDFDVVTITNITSDHLDYHKSWINYMRAKRNIIRYNLKKTGTAILNLDDPATKYLRAEVCNKTYYSTKYKKADFHARNIELGEISQFHVHLKNGLEFPIKTRLPGLYNIENILGVLGVLNAIGISLSDALSHITSFTGAKGRMHIVTDSPYTVIVDYAHTPNGLWRVLEAAQLFKKSPENNVIVIMGCGGMRDPSKRSIMGEIAYKYADITVIAPTDPRCESQVEINKQVVSGWEKGKNSLSDTTQKTLLISNAHECAAENRKAAFIIALNRAKPGDVIISTGKGHEKDISVNNSTIQWNDTEEFQKLLAQNVD